MCVGLGTHVKVRSLLPLCRYWGLNSDFNACVHMLLPTEPSHQPCVRIHDSSQIKGEKIFSFPMSS